MYNQIINADCLEWLSNAPDDLGVDMTFFDPPFLQGKQYKYFDDSQPKKDYWSWIENILSEIFRTSADGGTIYFMQREKNTEQVLHSLRESGWTFQNLIIWKKKTSAVPVKCRYSKQYQIIAFAAKGDKPRVFNKLRIDPPPEPNHRQKREQGVYLTDVWDDIRELTSGYYAGDEAYRDGDGSRLHTQQSPVALLLRIILSSTMPGDLVLDPFAGTGTTAVVARQLKRDYLCLEIDPDYTELIKERMGTLRNADNIVKHYGYYRFTPNLKDIWGMEKTPITFEQMRIT